MLVCIIKIFHVLYIHRGAEVIQQQIQQREQQRLLDAEKKDQETRAMIQHLNKMQQEDYEQLQKKKVAQLDLMKEIDKSNKVRTMWCSK